MYSKYMSKLVVKNCGFCLKWAQNQNQSTPTQTMKNYPVTSIDKTRLWKVAYVLSGNSRFTLTSVFDKDCLNNSVTCIYCMYSTMCTVYSIKMSLGRLIYTSVQNKLDHCYAYFVSLRWGSGCHTAAAMH